MCNSVEMLVVTFHKKANFFILEWVVALRNEELVQNTSVTQILAAVNFIANDQIIPAANS